MRRSSLAVMAFGALSLAQCASGPGNPGDFEGSYTGTLTTTNNVTAVSGPQTFMGSVTDTNSAVFTVEGSRAEMVDMIGFFDANACVMSFARSGDNGTQTGSTSCMASQSATFMGMTTMPSTSNITITGATLVRSGANVTLMANGTFTSTQTTSSATTTYTGTLTFAFSGTRR